MKHYLIIVEGPHDVAAICKVLRLKGFTEIYRKEQLSDAWHTLIPPSYPFKEDLLERVSPIPSFYQREQMSVAVKRADGDSAIIKTLDLILKTLPIESLSQLTGVAMICDADERTALERRERLYMEMERNRTCFTKTLFEDKIARVGGFSLKGDMFVFPDNNHSGTLEDVLVESAQIQYSDLLQNANTFVQGIASPYKERWTRSSEKKVLVGTLCNVFRPGAANQASILYDDWICEGSIEQSCLKELVQFVGDFLEV